MLNSRLESTANGVAIRFWKLLWHGSRHGPGAEGHILTRDNTTKTPTENRKKERKKERRKETAGGYRDHIASGDSVGGESDGVGGRGDREHEGERARDRCRNLKCEGIEESETRGRDVGLRDG
eukprot:2660371-Rhodomonas_salina.1